MNTRPIKHQDYTRLKKAGGHAHNYGKLVKRWLEKGYIEEPDCYVFERGSTLIGGVCFCDDTAEERQILDFAMVDIIPDGHEYLTDAVRQDARPNTRKISYNLYNDTAQYADIQQLFCKAGFIVAQEKHRYTYEGATFVAPLHDLQFKTLAEVGEEQYIRMVESVTDRTLDQLMADDAARLSSWRAAKEYVDGLKEIDFNPEWWKLGYINDTPVGLILPQRFNETEGTINYVGVLPEHRGKGYGLVLLAEGTRILVENGMKKIYADIDATNKPLAAQLKRLGYVFQMDEVVLVWNKPPIVD